MIQGVAAAWAAVTLTFFGLRLGGGDPLAGLLAQGLASPEQAAALRQRLGLDRPLGWQYLEFLSGAARGDLGVSLYTFRPVAEVVGEQFPHSLALGGAALSIGLVIGSALGIASGWSRGRGASRLAGGLAVLSTALPVAFTGVLALWLIGPILGAARSPATRAARLLLPAAVLGFASAGAIAKVIGSGLRANIASPFLLAARARGVRRGPRLLWHALRPVLGTAISLAALEAAFLFGGTVITESVFARPGLGRLLVASILQGDYPVVQGVVVLAALIYTLTQILGDLAVQWTDPRWRSPG